jgi:AcrR family transcriptional regulator
MLEAAVQTLREEGFAGTTARAIAQRGGFNQALVFYHYGGVNELLLAALDRSSADRLASYRAAVEESGSAAALVERLAELYREDVAGGQVTLVSDLVGASLTHPELAPKLLERMRPWLDLVRESLDRLLRESPLAGVVPAGEVSFAVVALYLGLNLLSRLDPANDQVEGLFDLMRRVAPLLAP